MEFESIFELLEAVRQYRLRARESLVPTTSVTGTVLGYATADSEFPSITWTISSQAVKDSTHDWGTREAQRIRELFVSHMGRRQLLSELRDGLLEYGIARGPAPAETLPEPPETPQGPRQLQLPL